VASDVSDSLRQFVANRAGNRCEYCLLHADNAYFRHQVDHILSRKHGGLSISSNLALACIRCNAWKGTDLGTIELKGGLLIAFFNPRQDKWLEHFVCRGALIEPLTPRGEVTARLLRFNLDKRVAERRLLISAGRYP
jgi:HNH endonuclease